MNYRAEAPSNIALIKYWGKEARQLPMNPSLSLTLKASVSRVELTVLPQKRDEVSLIFEGERQEAFGSKVARWIERLKQDFSALPTAHYQLTTHNTFPHSAGIASSASFFAALTRAFHPYLESMLERSFSLAELSCLARLGSGSACRSLAPGVQLWGRCSHPGSSDEFAVTVEKIHPAFQELGDAILILDASPKKISSSHGHALMAQHPYREARQREARERLERMLSILREGDWQGFIALVEREALDLHGLMLSAPSPYILMAPATLQAIQRIQGLRERHSLPLAFTLDAGANLHLLYDRRERGAVLDLLAQELQPLCWQAQWIDDRNHHGPL